MKKIYIKTTESCNLCCDHCYIGEARKNKKFFDEDTLCHVTYTAPTKGKPHVDMRIEYRSHTYLAEDDVEDLYYGIEALIGKIERQCRKVKEENIGKKRSETIEIVTEEENEE